MIRALNIAFIAITGLLCLGLYRIAEEARIAAADLKATNAGIVREHDALIVLGAEWARLTQPARIQALAARHLDLTDQPQVELSSLTLLPPKAAPLDGAPVFRDAKAVMPLSGQPAASVPAPASPEPAPLPAPIFASLHTGT